MLEVGKFIMKNVILAISLLMIPCAFADEVSHVQPQLQVQNLPAAVSQSQPVNPLIVPQNISYENCTKIFGITREKLFYLTLVSLSANRFVIDEMQSANGYIIFSANHNKYLATVAGIDDKNAILKITPCNNIYKFPPGIITNTFKYIDLNLTTKI